MLTKTPASATFKTSLIRAPAVTGVRWAKKANRKTPAGHAPTLIPISIRRARLETACVDSA